jgi:hypothetical protein
MDDSLNFDDTIKDQRLFLIFSLALISLSKSAHLLLERGADPSAITHINRGIEMISGQLSEAAGRLETELHANREIDEICQKLGILRPSAPEAPAPPN